MLTARLAPLVNELKSIKSSSDLFSWRYPLATGAVFGVSLTVMIFFCTMQYTMVTFLCRIYQVLLATGLILSFVNKGKMNMDNIQGNLERALERATPVMTRVIDDTYNVMTWRDFKLSGKVLTASLVVAFMGNRMPDSIFLLLALIVAFVSPIVYQQKRKEIDAVLEKVNAVFDKYLSMLRTKAEDAQKKVEDAKRKAEEESKKDI